MTVVSATDNNIATAGLIHSVSWCESHKDFCTEDFLSLHTPEHQTEYLCNKMKNGTCVYLLIDDIPVGIVSVTDSLIEDLYVLPDHQNKGYGTALLHFAENMCKSAPTLWILDNNKGAERLYAQNGYKFTGKKARIADGLYELELILAK